MIINFEDLLEYEIEDFEIVEVINGHRPYTDVMDRDYLLLLLEDMNREYCDEHNLCEICRTPLRQYPVYEEYWGGKVLMGTDFRCPNGC